MRLWASLIVGWIAGGVAAAGLTMTGYGDGVLGFGVCFALTATATLSTWRLLNEKG